jgi:plastocyanin
MLTRFAKLVIAASFFFLIGSTSSRASAAKSTFIVLAGTDTPYGVSVLAFAPQTIKVHRGDTITWQVLGFHDIRFSAKPADLITITDIDGKKLPEINPAIALPSLPSGGVYKVEMGSGLPGGPDSATYSVVMDVEPGTYSYLCDVHPGMVGTIVVVDDKTDITSPAEVVKAGKAELEANLATADKTFINLIKTSAQQTQGDTVNISNGGWSDNTTILKNFPDVAVIQAGQSVTWTVPKGFEAHTVNMPLPKDAWPEAVGVVFDSNKTPHLTLTDIVNPNVKDGDTLPADGVVKSGLMIPGQSLTMKFAKPGIYTYYCALHPGQVGTIVVSQPQS